MTTRLRHTPCAQPIDFTADQQLLEPDTDQPHTCPIDGPHHVIRWGTSWTVRNVLDDRGDTPRYPTHDAALTEAIRRNSAQQRRARPQQRDLFQTQEEPS